MKKTSTLFGTFLKIGAFTFGGGYAMVALLEHEFVEEKQWMSREEFLDMVAIAESTPGPVAVNSATYIGYKIGGTNAFKGIQACVVYLILSAGLKMLKQLKKDPFDLCILAAVVAAMVGCSLAAVSFSSIYYILLSGAAGVLVWLVAATGCARWCGKSC